jgi:hypothetical protein
MTVHSVTCTVALNKAAVTGYHTGYSHTSIPYEGEKDMKIKVMKFDKNSKTYTQIPSFRLNVEVNKTPREFVTNSSQKWRTLSSLLLLLQNELQQLKNRVGVGGEY